MVDTINTTELLQILQEKKGQAVRVIWIESVRKTPFPPFERYTISSLTMKENNNIAVNLGRIIEITQERFKELYIQDTWILSNS
jgi:hypothetical protein